ncbi:YceD family protein [Cytophaga hutchinsonii]|uniref:DUF177 domain-containing protein n=1 Tax=Cytophaga hutchinsonii (strain ATCC 33406 / DSM 1761 / CIP 103989 / NBRC 15051 / NCIMB 9469 / D465) TaxID=269798 RepID=A0A6N4SRH3_CYTH3|nr:DUF177 domain-containing protein [Cytophaga hutchinsonii]ABG58895.1 conserved hypothetical protein [Cytophaga hutchinsonii ATCC 33406]SFX81564.1 Uncharacterized metal-binding protein YceD, DUF177 family [Cytophaga hutchinsonii ATCC 33406]
MQKNRLRDFDIEISHVKEHTPHKFEFQLNDSFFTLFEDSLIQKGSVTVDVEFEKTPLLIRMNFILNGVVELVCDRSLDTFEQPISSENVLLFKYSEEEGEITEEIIGIKRETIKINIAQYIYEFINLEVPIKKLHPRFQEEEVDNDTSETLLIYSTETENEEKSESPTEDLIDPRWLALKSLKDKSKLN